MEFVKFEGAKFDKFVPGIMETVAACRRIKNLRDCSAKRSNLTLNHATERHKTWLCKMKQQNEREILNRQGNLEFPDDTDSEIADTAYGIMVCKKGRRPQSLVDRNFLRKRI